MNLLFILSALLFVQSSHEILQTENDTLSVLHVAEFSQLLPGDFEHPPEWDTMNFTGISRTKYTIEEIDGKTAVKANSEQSSSGLVREVDIDLKEYPVMRWTWRVENTFEKGNVTEKSGDDYPARVYLLFDYDIKNISWGLRQRIRVLRTFYGRVPTRAINYIWESSEPVGTIVENPYTRLVTMVVVESGEDNLGKWVTYERNVYEDYKTIYGEEPPKIGGVAIMTDSDDTGESAVAYFGDISFHRE